MCILLLSLKKNIFITIFQIFSIIIFYLSGHEVYLKGTACYERIVKEFGQEIVSKNGEIQRRSLGSIVFSNPVRFQN